MVAGHPLPNVSSESMDSHRADIFCDGFSTKSVKKIAENMYRVSHWRSILKGVTWRALGTIATVGIAWVVTGRLSIAATIGVGEVLFKVGAFYLHERVWDRISFGRKRPQDYEI